MTDTNGKTQPVRAAIDSTVMLILARFFMPVVVAALGWFMTSVLDELKRTNHQMQVQLEKLNDTQTATNMMQSGLSVKVDNAVKQIDHLQMQLDSLPKH